MSTKRSAGRVRSTYEFIKASRDKHSVQAMCRVLGVAPSPIGSFRRSGLPTSFQQPPFLPWRFSAFCGARQRAPILECAYPEPCQSAESPVSSFFPHFAIS